MNSRHHKNFLFLCVVAGIFMMYGCAPYTSTVVHLNRGNYICKNDPDQFVKYKGKRILLSTIRNEARNTRIFAYYNPESTIGYQLFYSSAHTMPQPLVSYFWYALQKGFECAGVKIDEYGLIYDAELSLVIRSLTDEEIIFRVLLMKPKGTVAYQKDYVVTMPKVQSNQPAILEERSYRMLDAIVSNILGDPEFQKAFF